MYKIRRFLRWHPIGSVFIIVAIIIIGAVSSWAVFKLCRPNTVYYTQTGLRCNDETYRYLPEQWDFVEEPDRMVGKIYNSNYGLFPFGQLYAFSNDSNASFVMDKGDAGIFGKYPDYFVKEALPFDPYDFSIIEKIIFESDRKEKAKFEITDTREIEKIATYLKGTKTAVNTSEPLVAPTYDHIYFYYKDYGVRYQVGLLKEGFDSGELFFEDNSSLYSIPKDIKEVINKKLTQDY